MQTSLFRTAALALTPAAAVVALATMVPSAGAAFTASEPQVCQYSFDQNWRVVPVTLSGELVNQDGDALAEGLPLVPGTKVRLADASVRATLPGWIAPFAYDGNVIPAGTSSIPVKGWISVEGTNTVEGMSEPIAFDTHAISHVNVPDGEAPTEETAYFDDVVADFEGPTWTASGGDVLVRQSVATKMAPIAAGRDGSVVQVNGTLFVSAQLDANTRLFLDCVAGGQLADGSAHSDKLASPLTTNGFRVPGFGGTVDGDPVPVPATATAAASVDAQLQNSTVYRGTAGQAVTVDGSTLRLRLTSAQRTAWLGGSGSPTVTGNVTIHGDRSAAPSTQSVSVVETAVPATGGTDIVLPLSASTWTPTDASGVDLRSGDTITLTAGGKDLVLTRNALRPTAYPFAYVLGPDPRTKFEDDTPNVITPTNPPDLTPPGGFAPPPAPRPKVVVKKTTTVKIATSSVKRSKGKVKIKLTNLSKKATTKGRFTLVTKSKYKLGTSKKARTITFGKATSFTLAKGKSKTYTVTLSKDAATLLKTRKSLKVTVKATPAITKTQATVSRTVTVRR